MPVEVITPTAIKTKDGRKGKYLIVEAGADQTFYVFVPGLHQYFAPGVPLQVEHDRNDAGYNCIGKVFGNPLPQMPTPASPTAADPDPRSSSIHRQVALKAAVEVFVSGYREANYTGPATPAVLAMAGSFYQWLETGTPAPNGANNREKKEGSN